MKGIGVLSWVGVTFPLFEPVNLSKKLFKSKPSQAERRIDRDKIKTVRNIIKAVFFILHLGKVCEITNFN